MGFFSNLYTKPGPGVGKNEPEKRRIVVFFEVFFRHFWKLEQTNLVFLLFLVPIILLVYLLNYLGFQIAKDNALIINFLTFLPLSLLGIPMMGLTYSTRNFAREEHVFVWFDFIDQVKKNWKAGLRHGLVSFFVYFCGYVGIEVYSAQLSTSWVFMIPFVVLCIALIAFTFAQYYIFPMIITFELSYKNIIKNGFLFSLIALLRNVLLSLLHLAVWSSIVWYFFDPTGELLILGILALLIGIPAFTAFLNNFVTYPLLLRFIIKPMYSEDETEADSSYKEGDHYKPLETDEKSEYVFENGRLVRRMDDVEAVFEDRK